MIIERIEIENFRSLETVKIDCEGLVAFVGRNGSGKSSILYALDAFYDVSASITNEDFYNRDTDREIVIRVTYGCLSDDEQTEFRSYIRDNKLMVTKKIGYTDTGVKQRYFGAALQIAEFAELRRVGKRDRINGWNELVATGKYHGLGPAVRRSDDADNLMDQYETDHSELMIPVEREEQFFGPRNVGGGKLDKYTRYVHVPAVREAAIEEGRRGAIYELIDTIVIRKINQRQDVRQLRADFEERVADVYSPENLTELDELSASISQLLSQYAPGAELRLRWGDPKVPDIPPPPAYARLIDEGYECPISHSGHGLQRSLILTLLQQLATTQPSTPTDNDETDSDQTDAAEAPPLPSPDLILAIEEPELYLHPSRCRYLADLLLRLAEPPAEVGQPRNQIIYATHSAYFVDLHRFNQVRIARRTRSADKPAPTCRVSSYTLGDASLEMARINDRDPTEFTSDSFRARSLPVFTPVVSEGFFADTVVVVEGQADVGAFSQLQLILGKKWHDLGIVVVSAEGKENVDRPVVVFRGLGIPTYFVFDGDAGDENNDQAKNRNKRYQRLAGVEPVDFPQTTEQATWAVFHRDIEDEIKQAVGVAEYESIRSETAQELGYGQPTRVEKNAEGVARLITKIYDAKLRVPILEQILERVTALRTAGAVGD